jgi:DNA-binding MarR family transcriptional regulator
MSTTPSPSVTPPGSDRPRLALLLRRAWYGLNQTFRRRIAGMGVTPDQFTILRWLGEHPEGLTQRALADLMASDPNTITAILTRMQKAGLIERRAHAQDARCNLIVLKDKGRSVHAKLQPLASDLQEQLLAAVPVAKQAEFLKQLESVCAALDAEDAAQPTRKGRRKA